MDGTQTGKACGTAERYRWAFAYSVTGDVRFISHHDTLRLFRRALARATLPVRFSEGFNPHPRMNIPLPRPVGLASDAEILAVEFEREIDADEAILRLQRQMPEGIEILSARRLCSGERLEALTATYRLGCGDDAPADLAGRIRRAMESDAIPVERIDHSSGRVRTVDVRPYLADMRLEGDEVEFVLRITGGGTAKPAEIAGLLGYDPDSINHRIQRIEVQWRQT
jgi:radical SAM-linked protein